MTIHNTLYPASPQLSKTPVERQHLGLETLCSVPASLLADLRQSALALAFRNLQFAPASRMRFDETEPLGICQECCRGSANWMEIPHAPSCETGRVLRLTDATRAAVLRGVEAAPADDPEFVETYSVELDQPDPLMGQCLDVRA